MGIIIKKSNQPWLLFIHAHCVEHTTSIDHYWIIRTFLCAPKTNSDFFKDHEKYIAIMNLSTYTTSAFLDGLYQKRAGQFSWLVLLLKYLVSLYMSGSDSLLEIGAVNAEIRACEQMIELTDVEIGTCLVKRAKQKLRYDFLNSLRKSTKKESDR